MATNITGTTEVTDALIPVKESNEIIQDAVQQSVVLSNARKARMGTKTERQPVLDALPTAKFVDGETGLKHVSQFTFKNSKLIAEEVAVILPMPDSVVDDASVDLWSIARPLAAEAVGAAVDGLLDSVVDGVTGRLVPPGDVSTLSGALRDLLDQPRIGRRLGRAGRVRAVAHYDWRVVTRSTEQALEEIRSPRPVSARLPSPASPPSLPGGWHAEAHAPPAPG